MFGVDDTIPITVYNDSEERYDGKDKDGEYLLAETCCYESDQSNGIEGRCRFQVDCTGDMKAIHRQLLLGEPFKLGTEEGSLSWTPITTEAALDKAIDVINRTESNLEMLLKTNLAYNDEHLYVAVTLVRTFIQLNYTGPDMSHPDVKKKLEVLESVSKQKFESGVLDLVEVDGIEIDSTIQHPVLLLLANYFLTSLKSHSATHPFYLFWRFRIDFLHQRSLSRRCWSISRRLKYCAEKYIEWMAIPVHEMSGTLADLNGSFLCEIAEMLVYYYDGILSERVLTQAMKVLQLTVEYSGKMGVRTKFQQTPMPQTVVNVTLTANHSETKRLYPCMEKYIPKSEALNDDTRLDRLRLVDSQDSEQSYRDIHQLVLLGLMLHKRGFQGESDLKRQEEEALINAIIDCPVNWAGRISALVARCQLEKLDRRAVDRSLRQIEEISKALSRQMETSEDVFRQYLFFGCGHPLKSEIMIIFGEVLLSLEHWKEALRIYTDLGAFDQIVRCYEMMSLRHKAEELVREKIAESGKTPKLLVLLGDVTSDISFYEEAWTLSSEKSLNSQIRLGSHYFKREEFKLAITHLKRVVELAPLEYPCWIKLAWACYRTEDYETAFQAYLRAANLEYDNFQVWNNLANCALKLNRKDYALRAYKVAVKCSYDEWRVWSNILVVASELNVLTDSIQAYHRILDLNKTFTDEAILEKMVNIGVKSSKANSITLSSLAKLFGRITATTSRSPIVWLLYGRVLASYIDCDEKDCEQEIKTSNFERAMHNYDKALALMRQNPSWKSDVLALQNVVMCISEFRENRDRGRIMLNDESNNRLKGVDSLLRQTALSVYENLKKLIGEVLVANEKLQTIFDEMTEEIKNPFYA